MFKTKRLSQIGLLTGVGAVLPAVGTAEASPVCTTSPCIQIQPFTVTSSPAEVNTPGTNTSHDPQTTTATFGQFDPSLGTLTEIDFSLLNSTLSGTVSVSADSSNEGPGAFASGRTDWEAEYVLTLPGNVGTSDIKNDFAS